MVKILLVGDAYVGKSYYLEKMFTGVNSRNKNYTPTIGAEIHTLQFETVDGKKVFADVWDTAGDEKYAGLREAYYYGADAVIYFIDEKKTKKNWKLEVDRVVPDIPHVGIDRRISETAPTFAFRKIFKKLGQNIV
jgi:GTP-binding nuclear protein Ran